MHGPILEPVLSQSSTALSLSSLFITRIIPLSVKVRLLVAIAIDFALTLLAQCLVSFDDFSIVSLLHFNFSIVQIQKMIYSFPFSEVFCVIFQTNVSVICHSSMISCVFPTLCFFFICFSMIISSH
jgi:hypothetical protein